MLSREVATRRNRGRKEKPLVPQEEATTLGQPKYHKHIASQKGSYEALFILEQTLGPRPETPLLDKIATPEEIKKLEDEAEEKDDILEDWHTPPGSPGSNLKIKQLTQRPSRGTQKG